MQKSGIKCHRLTKTKEVNVPKKTKGGLTVRPKKPNTSSGNPNDENETIERNWTVEALRKNDWNIAKAAKSLGMTQSWLTRLLRRRAFPLTWFF